MVLGHGAGGGLAARDLVRLAAQLPERGVDVALVEQPWRVAGRRVAPRPVVLDAAWCAAVSALGASGGVRGALVVGGRSAGARVACRTAATLGAVGVLALAFPLHPPGRPERSRRPELEAAGVPVLVVQGERDPFGAPAELGQGRFEVVPVADADHGFARPTSRGGPEPAWEPVMAAVVRWLDEVVPPGE